MSKTTSKQQSATHSASARKTTAGAKPDGAYTAIASQGQHDLDTFEAGLILGDPVTDEERKKLDGASRLSPEYLQLACTAWERFGAKTGIADFDTDLPRNALREQAALTPVLDRLTELGSRLRGHLFRNYGEAGLSARKLEAAIEFQVKREGHLELKPILDELVRLRRATRPRTKKPATGASKSTTTE